MLVKIFRYHQVIVLGKVMESSDNGTDSLTDDTEDVVRLSTNESKDELEEKESEKLQSAEDLTKKFRGT